MLQYANIIEILDNSLKIKDSQPGYNAPTNCPTPQNFDVRKVLRSKEIELIREFAGSVSVSQIRLVPNHNSLSVA